MQKPLVIPCAGESQRVKAITLGEYPKIMMRVDENSTILEKVVKTAHQAGIPKVFLIALNQTHMLSMHEHLKAFVDVPNEYVDIVVHPRSNGSFNSIRTLVQSRPELNETGFLTVWSDISIGVLPDSSLDYFTKIFTDESGNYSWVCTDNMLEDIGHSGNVPGVYEISSKHMHIFKMRFQSEVTDLIEAIKLRVPADEIQRVPLSSKVVDLGDVNKYRAHTKQEQQETSQGRWFNEIKKTGDIVRKYCVADFGKARMKDEYDFYCRMPGYVEELFPIFWYGLSDATCLVMENLKDYTTVHAEYSKNQWFSKKELLVLVCDAFTVMHSEKVYVDREEICSSVIKEYVTKTVQRLQEHQSTLSFFGSARRCIDNAEKILLKHADTAEFSVIHGDPNAENIMVNAVGEIKFIDPKGRFGDHSIIGDSLYDYAKFIYGLTIFNDLDNDCKQSGMISLEQYRDKIEVTEVRVSNMIHQLGLSKDYDVLKIMIGLIALSLPKFVKQDINKMIFAKELGIYLLKTQF